MHLRCGFRKLVLPNLNRMKRILLAAFLLLGFQNFAQTDTVIVTSDTVDVYVISSTNRLVEIEGDYAIEYRDLKNLKNGSYLHFDSGKDLEKFFASCFRSLEKGIEIASVNYTLSRNKLSKNVVRVQGKEKSYFMLKYDTLEKMKTAYERDFN